MAKKFILSAVGIVVVLVLLFVAVVAMQPSEFHVERSATMSAPPEAVFAQVNDFRNWQAWSPWARLDPDAKNSFEGPQSGEGAVFRWDGNEEVGQGSMTITESQPYERVRMRLDFVKPMEDTATVGFDLKPVGEQTEVTWTMGGKNNFVGRAICMFMNMDKMIGEKYEEGLANIKKIVEEKPAGES